MQNEMFPLICYKPHIVFVLGVVAKWCKVLTAVPCMVWSTLALGTYQLRFVSWVFHVIFSFVHFISLYTLGGLRVFRKPLPYNMYLFNLQIANHILIIKVFLIIKIFIAEWFIDTFHKAFWYISYSSDTVGLLKFQGWEIKEWSLFIPGVVTDKGGDIKHTILKGVVKSHHCQMGVVVKIHHHQMYGFRKNTFAIFARVILFHTKKEMCSLYFNIIIEKGHDIWSEIW